MTIRAAWAACAFLVAGCASAPVAPAPASVRAVAPSGAIGLNLGRPDALSLRDALAAFGPADVDRREGQGAILTWKLERCALILVFAADAAGALRAQAAQAGVRRAGETAVSLDQCLEAAEAR